MTMLVLTGENRRTTEWHQVLLLVCAGVVAAFQIGKVPPVLTAIREDLGMSLVLSGWVLSAFNIIGVLMSPLAGGIADALGHRKVIRSGFICLAAGSLTGGLSHQTVWLLASRILEGMGYIFVVVSIPGLMVKMVKDRDRSVAFGLWSCFMPAGGALMMVLSPFLFPVFDWRGIWIANGVLIAGVAILVHYNTRHIAHSGPNHFSLKKMSNGICETLKTPGILILALSFLTFSQQFLTLIGFLPGIMVQQNHIPADAAALITAFILAMHIPGNLLGGWLLQRGTARWKILCLSQVLVGGGGCVQFLAVPLGVRLVCGVCFAVGGGMIATGVLSGVAAMAPKPFLVGTSNGVAMQGAQIGLLSGPPLVALLVSASGDWRHALALLIPVASLSIVLSLVLKRFPDSVN